MRKLALTTLALILALFVCWFALGTPTFETTPYSLPASPMVAYRITGSEADVQYFADDPNSIRGFAIVQEQAITDAQLEQDVIGGLSSRLIYGSDNIRCFEPAIAVRFGEGDNAIDALICLSCRHVYFYHGGQIAYRRLNSLGVDRIEQVFARLFPGHSPVGSDADTQRVAAARALERERREQASLEPTSNPTAE
jgi:hypothetical protein